MTSVYGAKAGNPKMSAMAEPTPPANPPTYSPNRSALTKIIMSPKLRYPDVAGTGTRIIIVETVTAEARTTERVIFVVVERRFSYILITLAELQSYESF
jgi:hypothetical protein